MTGDFRNDGSWNPEGTPPETHDPHASLYWFVDSLVTARRRNPARAPWEFALRIGRSRWGEAFPLALEASHGDRRRWSAVVASRGESVPIPFFAVGCRTSAEAAVVFGGYAHGRSDDLHPIEALFRAEVEGRSDLPVTTDLRAILAGLEAAFS